MSGRHWVREAVGDWIVVILHIAGASLIAFALIWLLVRSPSEPEPPVSTVPASCVAVIEEALVIVDRSRDVAATSADAARASLAAFDSVREDGTVSEDDVERIALARQGLTDALTALELRTLDKLTSLCDQELDERGPTMR